MGNWNDLLIKGIGDSDYMPGYSTYHVRMGRGFIDAIESGVPLKEPIENDSRLEHGVRMLVSNRKAKRTVTLAFNIHGGSQEVYMSNKRNFENMLQKGLVSLKINDSKHPYYYHLVYTGKSVTYKHSYNGVFGIMTMQFIEPNPSNRTATASTHVRVVNI